MRRHALGNYRRAVTALLAGVLATSAVGLAASVAGADSPDRLTSVEGTIWAANRGVHTIQGFDASTGDVVRTVAMRAGSQPGDLAFARGKLYVAEEFGTPPAIAIVDPGTGAVTGRIDLPPLSRPHHVHASRGGKLVAFGLYGTDDVAVVDTQTDTLLGRWDIDPAGESGRAHAGVFSPKGRILYVASDASNEVVALDPRTGEIFWRLAVIGAHELVVTRNGETAYVSRRTANKICVLDLIRHDACIDVFTFGLPDTMRLARHDRLLTVTLRTMPAQMACHRHPDVRLRARRDRPERSRPTRSPGTSGRHATGGSRSRRSRGERARVSPSSITGTGNRVIANPSAIRTRPHGVDCSRATTMMTTTTSEMR